MPPWLTWILSAARLGSRHQWYSEFNSHRVISVLLKITGAFAFSWPRCGGGGGCVSSVFPSQQPEISGIIALVKWRDKKEESAPLLLTTDSRTISPAALNYFVTSELESHFSCLQLPRAFLTFQTVTRCIMTVDTKSFLLDERQHQGQQGLIGAALFKNTA